MEKDIEAYVRDKMKLEKLGYLLKWVSPGETGVPDRIAVLPDRYQPIEFKQPGGRLSPRQKMWQRRLPDAIVIENMDQAKEWLNEIRTAYLPRQNDKTD